jgi:hypothetical protein
MIVAAVLNGWAASSRKEQTRTHTLVEALLGETGVPYELLGLKAMFVNGRSRRIRQFIIEKDRSENVLLCVGKSLGARNMVLEVLNQLPRLFYVKTFLGTIDPNWPESWDITPNLNRCILKLTRPMTAAANIYFVSKDPRQQAGAMLGASGDTPVLNIPVTDCDHFSIVQHPETRKMLQALVTRAAEASC